MSLIAHADMGCEELGGVMRHKKKKMTLQRTLVCVCASVMVTDSSRYDTLPHTSGKSGGGEGHSDTETGLGFDLCNAPRLVGRKFFFWYHLFGCVFCRSSPYSVEMHNSILVFAYSTTFLCKNAKLMRGLLLE